MARGRRKNLKVSASIDSEEFREDYLEHRLSHRAFAAKYNCSKTSIPLLLEKFGREHSETYYEGRTDLLEYAIDCKKKKTIEKSNVSILVFSLY